MTTRIGFKDGDILNKGDLLFELNFGLALLVPDQVGRGKEDNMQKGYWVGRVDVIKPEGYQAYGVVFE